VWGLRACHYCQECFVSEENQNVTLLVNVGPVPDYVPSTASLVFQRAYTLFRWALWPTAFVACTYAVGYVPQAKDVLTDWVPDIFSLRPGRIRA